MLALAERVPDLLDQLDALPQTFAHGDASPENLLIPDGNPERVVIDWGFGTPLPIGFDLGQLLVGLAHSGRHDPARFPTGAPDRIGLLRRARRRGVQPRQLDVHTGFIGGMAVRSAY